MSRPLPAAVTKPTRVLAFARVSGNDLEAARNEQQADRQARLQEQLQRLDAYAVAMGWPKPLHFSEIESGGEKYGQDTEGLGLDDFLSRPRGVHRRQQRKLLQELRPGDVILVTKSDRWSRDSRFDADVSDFIRARSAKWHSLQEPWLWDSPVMVRGMVGLSKEQERDTIRERMVGARQRQRDAGMYVEGLPPFGYQRAPRIGAKLQDRFLHRHPDHAPLVVKVFERCIRGESVEDIASWLRTKGIIGRHGNPRRWFKQDIGRMLRSRVYLGEVTNSKGEWIKAGHDAIVDVGTWARAQAGLDTRRLGGSGRKVGNDDTSHNSKWVLKGIANCSNCGRRMGSAYKKDRDGNYSYFFYACNGRMASSGCRAPYVQVAKADAHACQLALDYLQSQRHHMVAKKTARTDVPDFTATRKKLMARRGRVLDMFEAGDLNGAERKQRLDKITSEMTTLDAQEAAQVALVQTHDPKRRADLLQQLGALERAWGGLTPVKRREVIKRLASSITVDGTKDEPVAITWYTPEELMLRR